MTVELFLQDILRQIASGLMIPVMIVLALFILYAVFSIGSVIVEVILERRHFKQNVPGFITQIEMSDPEQVISVIERSGMLLKQKSALIEVARNMGMSAPDLYALAKDETAALKEDYANVTARTDMCAKLAPLFGLMGTLIPLGPGIVAMGQGQTQVLATSLLVAFDTTVAGLISAAVFMVVSRVRKSWYKRYMEVVAASMTAVIDRAEALRTGAGAPGRTAAAMAAPQSAAAEPQRDRDAGLSFQGGGDPRRMRDHGVQRPSGAGRPDTTQPMRAARAAGERAGRRERPRGLMGAAMERFAGAGAALGQQPDQRISAEASDAARQEVAGAASPAQKKIAWQPAAAGAEPSGTEAVKTAVGNERRPARSEAGSGHPVEVKRAAHELGGGKTEAQADKKNEPSERDEPGQAQELAVEVEAVAVEVKAGAKQESKAEARAKEEEPGEFSEEVAWLLAAIGGDK